MNQNDVKAMGAIHGLMSISINAGWTFQWSSWYKYVNNKICIRVKWNWMECDKNSENKVNAMIKSTPLGFASLRLLVACMQNKCILTVPVSTHAARIHLIGVNRHFEFNSSLGPTIRSWIFPSTSILILYCRKVHLFGSSVEVLILRIAIHSSRQKVDGFIKKSILCRVPPTSTTTAFQHSILLANPMEINTVNRTEFLWRVNCPTNVFTIVSRGLIAIDCRWCVQGPCVIWTKFME